MEEPQEDDVPSPSLRRGALIPVTTNISTRTPVNKLSTNSPDEFVIQQRGRRRKPIVWSPVDYNRKDLLGAPRDKTPERIVRGVEINSKLRRRLIMSPERNCPSSLGNVIAKKLRALSYQDNTKQESN